MEFGKDTQKEEFTVIGIGDMSGDVFGNGMLLSRKIKLIAAFNHIHIFLDPDPDCEKSYTERKRLFALPGSTWKDYDRNIISKGGGVFDRAAKRIELTQEIKKLLGIEKDIVTGEELIRYILMGKAELLWNGGIGTYVKDSSESHAEVGDKQNDNVRINADELKVKVVGEGGNLGFTQKARIRYALLGGKINTDAIDNSAGVDMSDHEVNIKILFEHLLKHRVIKDKKERDKIIMKITPEVVDLVLRDNIEQSRILSIEELNAAKNQLGYVDLAEYLKSIGLLNFELEKIDFIKEKRIITRPELAVLLAYTKLYIYDEVVDEIDITEPIAYRFYESYYPLSIIKNYKNYITEHKLVREICATVMVNKFINQNGMVSFLKLHKQYGKKLSVIIQRYFLAEELFEINKLRSFIDNLDRKGKTDGVYFSLIEIEKTLNVATEWLLHDSNLELLKNNLNNFHKLLSILPFQITGNARKSMKEFETIFDKFLLPEMLVKNISRIKFSKPVFDLFEITVRYEVDIEKLVKKYYLASDGLKLKSISQSIKKIAPSGYWSSANQENLLKKIKDIQKKVACKSSIKDNWLKNLFKQEETFFVNYFDFVKSLEEGETYDIVPFNVIVDLLDKVVELW
jgi:glutamate dehydrogenase